MLEAIAEWIDSIIVVDSEAFPVPSIDRSGACFDECDIVKGIIQTSGKSEVAQRLQSRLDSTRTNNGEMSVTFPIGDVLLFKEQEGQTKHVVAVEVCDEDGFNLSG